jgi:hypothetical protein
MVYRIKDIIESNIQHMRPIDYNKGLLDAKNKVIDAIRGNKISLVQGPPGTGKTTVYEQSINDFFDNIGNDMVLLYIAPTNQLVADMLKRIASIYYNKGKQKEDIKKELRVYGSQFDYDLYEKLAHPIDKEVRLILTTSYQRPYFRDIKNVCILIDEASKSPLHQPFITMTNSIIAEVGRSELQSISVIGDPKQAISLDSSYKGKGKELLIMNTLIKGLLHNKDIDVNDNDDLTELARQYLLDEFKFLSTTYRMPSPTEEPISTAYYGGLLVAKDSVDKRVKELWDNNKASQLCNVNENFKKTIDILEDTLTTSRGMIYVKVKDSYYDNSDEGFNYAEKRGIVGVYLAASLSTITDKRTAVITAYTDQWQQMKLYFQRHIYPLINTINPKIQEQISFSTIDKQIGSEEDIVVCILGKEYSTPDNPTRYYQEPELLNVQLTRHKRVLCIIGDLSRLRRKANELDSIERTTRYKELATTAEEILKQAGFDISGRRAHRTHRNGECVYHEWK